MYPTMHFIVVNDVHIILYVGWGKGQPIKWLLYAKFEMKKIHSEASLVFLAYLI